jgi:hypothetical protein
MRTSIALGATALALGLAGAALAGPYQPPRNGYGQPDLSGAWSNATLTPQVRPALYGTRRALTPEEVRLLEGAEAAKDAAGAKSTATAGSNVGAYDRGWIDNGVGVMRVAGEPRTSLITTPDGQPPPHRGQPPHVLPPNAGSPEAGREAIKQTIAFDQFEAQGSESAGRMGDFDNPEGRSVGERCLVGFGRNAGPPMFPNGWYNNNYQIQQGRDSVAIVVEMVHDARIVRLGARHRTDDVRPWFGDSIGHYEGDTLVVETDHIPQAQAYDGAWKDLKVTERFTRVGKDRLRYRFTVEAPSVWDKPWGGEYEFSALKGQVYEYACHEGNYALPGILAGARAAERKAAGVGAGKTAGR